jgi:putative FmdB family regulatory protein
VPTYEYRCKACGEELEVVQAFTDDALTTCDACGGQLRKVFGNVGISFKGSGFYKNDSRGKSTSTAASGDKATSESSSGATGDKADKADKSSSDASSTTKDAGSAPKKDAATSNGSSSGPSDKAKKTPSSTTT